MTGLNILLCLEETMNIFTTEINLKEIFYLLRTESVLLCSLYYVHATMKE